MWGSLWPKSRPVSGYRTRHWSDLVTFNVVLNSLYSHTHKLTHTHTPVHWQKPCWDKSACSEDDLWSTVQPPPAPAHHQCPLPWWHACQGSRSWWGDKLAPLQLQDTCLHSNHRLRGREMYQGQFGVIRLGNRHPERAINMMYHGQFGSSYPGWLCMIWTSLEYISIKWPRQKYSSFAGEVWQNWLHLCQGIGWQKCPDMYQFPRG